MEELQLYQDMAAHLDKKINNQARGLEELRMSTAQIGESTD